MRNVSLRTYDLKPLHQTATACTDGFLEIRQAQHCQFRGVLYLDVFGWLNLEAGHPVDWLWHVVTFWILQDFAKRNFDSLNLGAWSDMRKVSPLHADASWGPGREHPAQKPKPDCQTSVNLSAKSHCLSQTSQCCASGANARHRAKQMCQVRRVLFDQMVSEASQSNWQASSYHDNDIYIYWW